MLILRKDVCLVDLNR